MAAALLTAHRVEAVLFTFRPQTNQYYRSITWWSCLRKVIRSGEEMSGVESLKFPAGIPLKIFGV